MMGVFWKETVSKKTIIIFIYLRLAHCEMLYQKKTKLSAPDCKSPLEFDENDTFFHMPLMNIFALRGGSVLDSFPGAFLTALSSVWHGVCLYSNRHGLLPFWSRDGESNFKKGPLDVLPVKRLPINDNYEEFSKLLERGHGIERMYKNHSKKKKGFLRLTKE